MSTSPVPAAIAPDRIGEFFGIYGLVGKGSQVIGQLLYGLIIFLLVHARQRAQAAVPALR